MDNFALLRALESEQRARNASDPAVKKEWEVLAMEWHLLATRAALWHLKSLPSIHNVNNGGQAGSAMSSLRAPPADRSTMAAAIELAAETQMEA